MVLLVKYIYSFVLLSYERCTIGTFQIYTFLENWDPVYCTLPWLRAGAFALAVFYRSYIAPSFLSHYIRRNYIISTAICNSSRDDITCNNISCRSSC